jgi:myo-inositol 2-dehydrogenase/D-chiro-inositol 1-dehydrogenase
MSPAVPSRRQFLQTSGAAAASVTAPYWWTGTSRATEEAAAKAEQKNFGIGAIGLGGQGLWIAKEATSHGTIVAVCDVDANRLTAGNAKVAGGKAAECADYRRLLDRKDIDAVTIGTPDHWHSKIAIEALQAGKHVYCEKPLTLTIDEGKLINAAVKKYGKVFQVGTQQRSSDVFQKAVGITREGRLGRIHRITCAIGIGPKNGPFTESPVPPELNWDLWQGQAPAVPYVKERCHYDFRWWHAYSGGKLTDWGAHHVDIAHWALGRTDTGPTLVAGRAEFPGIPGGFETASTFHIKCTFADGAELVICDTAAPSDVTPGFPNGILIEGDKGSIFVARGKLTGAAVDALAENPLPADLLTSLRKGKPKTSHMQNFFDCIKNGGEPISDAASHHRSLTTCHLANIALRLGRPVQWDPAAESVVGDAEAAAMEKRPQRAPYEIPVV